MKKIVLALALACALVVPTFAREKGGLMGGLHGCCFGLRGAAAYNDGKSFTAIEWIDALITARIIAFVNGWSGTTTADLREEYGAKYF